MISAESYQYNISTSTFNYNSNICIYANANMHVNLWPTEVQNTKLIPETISFVP